MSEDLSLRIRMDGFEENQKKTLEILRRVEFAILGDIELGHLGIIRTQELQKNQIETITKEIEKIKKVNNDQDVSINAKRIQTDEWIKWGSRIGITLVVVILVTVLLTGKIGIVDLIKAAL